jgi:hypothetical protein
METSTIVVLVLAAAAGVFFFVIRPGMVIDKNPATTTDPRFVVNGVVNSQYAQSIAHGPANDGSPTYNSPQTAAVTYTGGTAAENAAAASKAANDRAIAERAVGQLPPTTAKPTITMAKSAPAPVLFNGLGTGSKMNWAPK